MTDYKDSLLSHTYLQINNAISISNVNEDNISDDDDFEEVSIDGTSSIAPLFSSPASKKCHAEDVSTLMEDMESKSLIFKCINCKIYFPKQSMLETHMSTIHNRKKIEESAVKAGYMETKNNDFLCNVCYYSTKSITMMRCHIKLKHGVSIPKSQRNRTPSVTEDNATTLELTETDEDRQKKKGMTEDDLESSEQALAMSMVYETTDSSTNVTSFTCPYCPKTESNRTLVLNHMKKQHEDQWNERIASAEEEFDRKLHYCVYCSFVAVSRTTLLNHTRSKHPGLIQPAKNRKKRPTRLYECIYCDFTSEDRRKFQNHVERKHVVDPQYTCSYCDKKFRVRTDFSNHVKFQHTDEPIICEICGKLSSNSNSLHLHRKREHFQPEFECKLCHRRMMTKQNLDEHIERQHTNKTTFMCENCGKVFDQNSKLKIHAMTHTGERPHKCHICNRSFARRAVYRQHLLIHSGQRPYVCDICGKRFTQKPGLICHRKSHPGEKPPLPVVYIDHILEKYVSRRGSKEYGAPRQADEIIESKIEMLEEEVVYDADLNDIGNCEIAYLESTRNTSTSESTTKQTTNRGIFIFGRESLVMRKWQILEFDGQPYYAFVPEDESPLKEENIPEYPEDISFYADVDDDDDVEVESDSELDAEVEILEDSEESEEELPKEPEEGEKEEDEEEIEMLDIKPTIVNGKAEERAKSVEIKQKPMSSVGDYYQVKVEAGVVTLEKLSIKLASEINEPDDPDEESQDLAGFESMEEINDTKEQLESIEQEVSEIDTPTRTPSKSVEERTYKCKACSEIFNTRISFRKHVAWAHKKRILIQEDGLYICSVCDYSTPEKPEFADHLKRKHETYSRSKRQSNTSGAVFPCQACGFVCRSKHSLQSHFIRKHTDRYEHQCKFCSKKFKVKGDLTNHIRFHHKEKPVNCDVCGKQCQNSGSLYVHQKWAHYKPKYECPICHRRMVTQENLDQHMVQQHEKREKIVCAQCGKTFTKKDSFKRHMAVHTGDKPYNCVICNKLFARRSQLRQHLLIHTGKRPFVCDICGKAFTQKPGLICHRKTHPGKHPPLPVMPIGDIVENYLKIHAPGKKQEGLNPDPEDDPETEEEEVEEGEEIEEFYEEMVEEEVVEAEVEGAEPNP